MKKPIIIGHGFHLGSIMERYAQVQNTEMYIPENKETENKKTENIAKTYKIENFILEKIPECENKSYDIKQNYKGDTFVKSSRNLRREEKRKKNK